MNRSRELVSDCKTGETLIFYVRQFLPETKKLKCVHL